MKKVFGLALAAVAMTAMPVAAQTYDAFSTFTGTNTGGQFTYGSYSGVGPVLGSFTAYNDTPGCTAYISNVTCTSNGGLPGAFQTTTGAHQSGTVLVPGNALLFHPGANQGEAAAVLFTVPQASDYRVTFSGFVADTSPSGVNLVLFVPGAGGFSTTLATLSATNPSYSVTGVAGTVLPAGFTFGFAVDYAGNYSNDSTGINLSVSAIPEPATWAMMMLGFGMVGFGLRRRAKQAVRVTYA